MLVEHSEVVLALYNWAKNLLDENGAHFWCSDSITENRLSIWSTAYAYGFTHVAVYFESKRVNIIRKGQSAKFLDSFEYHDPALIEFLEGVFASVDKLLKNREVWTGHQ